VKTAVLCLAFGDPAASCVGILTAKSFPWARLRNGKSILGAFANFIVSLLVSAAFFRLLLVVTKRSHNVADQPFSQCLEASSSWKILVLTSAAAALSELVVPTPRLGILDDNLVVVLVTCAILNVAQLFEPACCVK